jgi:hypothetical protein
VGRAGYHARRRRVTSDGAPWLPKCVAAVKAGTYTVTAGFAAFGPLHVVGVVCQVKATSLNDKALVHQYQAYHSLDQDPINGLRSATPTRPW